MRRARSLVVILGALPPGCGGGEEFTSFAEDASPGGADAEQQSAPSCVDGARNGAESDVDCGGDRCSACADRRTCAAAGDCQSFACLGGVCQAPSCEDGVANGAETATDCGGGCPACAVCLPCAADADCDTGLCQKGLCAPTIIVISAVYAANCGTPTPVPTIVEACNGRQSCDYLFNYTVDIGYDPAYGCYKDLRVEYSCSGGAKTRVFYESCAPCDPQNTPTMITLDLFCDPCLGVGQPPD